jgi:phospholipid/cholesterol/gamma-HCH transport system substrate-binding protein
MPRTRSLAWSELKIGVLAIAGIVIVAITIFLLTGGKGFFWQRYSLKAKFTNVAGLNSGSPVRVAGVEVGTVTAVGLSGDQVEVTFEVNQAFRPQITDHSVARLGSVSLLGESAVDITPSSSGTPIPDGGYVPSGKAAAALSDITDSAGAGIAELTALIREMREGKGSIGKLLTDDALYAGLNGFVDSGSVLLKEIREGKGSMGRLVSDPKTVDTLNATLKNLEDVTGKLNSGQGSIGQLLKDDAFSKSLNDFTGNANTLIKAMNTGDGTIGKLVTDPALFNKLNTVSQRLDELMNNLNTGQGTMGRLLKDQQLYENMNKLIDEITKDPKKYLTVHVSIF